MKSKECPKCKKLHEKDGTFCSRACANSRTHSEETKLKIAKSCKGRVSALKGRESPFKGKQRKKHTEETKLKISELRKGKKRSEETKLKMSLIAIARGFGGNTSKKKFYFEKNNGEVVYLQSSYELLFAQLLEKLGIEWERPASFIWIDDLGISHRYYPDFKINNIYIDTKNDYLAVKDLPKINAVKQQNNIDLRIVTKESITEEYIARLV